MPSKGTWISLRNGPMRLNKAKCKMNYLVWANPRHEYWERSSLRAALWNGAGVLMDDVIQQHVFTAQEASCILG